MACHDQSYAIPCWLYSGARKFFHMAMKPGAPVLFYQMSHAQPASVPRKRVMRGPCLPRFGTAFLEHPVVSFDITQALLR
jgi:hypothetical protein